MNAALARPCQTAPLASIRAVANLPVTVIETPQFARQADEVWTASERHAFIDHIARNPQAGDLIAGTGGVRKLRWSRPGIGKRGGVRVIYFCHQPTTPLYLLMGTSKNPRFC